MFSFLKFRKVEEKIREKYKREREREIREMRYKKERERKLSKILYDNHKLLELLREYKVIKGFSMSGGLLYLENPVVDSEYQLFDNITLLVAILLRTYHVKREDSDEIIVDRLKIGPRRGKYTNVFVDVTGIRPVSFFRELGLKRNSDGSWSTTVEKLEKRIKELYEINLEEYSK